jgi:hypothetical protein
VRRDRLLDLQHETERARVDYHDSIRRLHAAGGSLREIADNLALSHQRIHQIVEGEAQCGQKKGERKRLLERVRRERPQRPDGPFFGLTERARTVVSHAHDEAKALKHDYVGTEHLLLGLLSVENGLAARALASLAIELEDVRSEIRRVVGEGQAPVSGRLRLTPRSKKVHELARREAEALGHNYVGTEHLLLGLAAEAEGVAARILCGLGADAENVRAAVLRMLAA